MSDLAIETQELSKAYPGVRAVDGLNLSVPRGAVYGFLGRNGAGKTTTMKMLLGLARPNGGTARVLGFDAGSQQTKILERTAFVGERKVLYDSLTGAEMARFTAGFYPSWAHATVEKYARRLDIPMNKRLAELSHGNRTKVCLLLALAQGADLLILDEPTMGLDPVMIDEVLRALLEHNASEGRAIFFSSHQLAEVEQVAEWVGVIDHGKLLLEARVEDIKSEFRLVTATGNGLPRLESGQVISSAQEGEFWKYVVARDAEAFAGELRRQGATIINMFPLSLREIFLELVRKEEPCTSGNAGATPALVSSSS